MKLCSSCLKTLSKKNDSKSVDRKADQHFNEQDQTAAESEVDQALEDTRCQSSLLTSKNDSIAHSQLINFKSQFYSF
jgi:hypothetical protein